MLEKKKYATSIKKCSKISQWFSQCHHDQLYLEGKERYSSGQTDGVNGGSQL